MTAADLAAGQAARDEGMAASVQSADPRVILAIDAAIARANASARPWSANTIRKACPEPGSQGLIGARVRAAASRRPVEQMPVGYEPSDLPSTHAHPIRVWLGVEAYRAAYPNRPIPE